MSNGRRHRQYIPVHLLHEVPASVQLVAKTARHARNKMPHEKKNAVHEMLEHKQTRSVMRMRDEDRYLEDENKRQSCYHYIIEHVRASVVVRVILRAER